MVTACGLPCRHPRPWRAGTTSVRRSQQVPGGYPAGKCSSTLVVSSTIQGKIELKILPFLAVALHDVQLGKLPGFGTQPLATVRSASVGVKLLPLLGKRIEVRRIAIDGERYPHQPRGDQQLAGPDRVEAAASPPQQAHRLRVPTPPSGRSRSAMRRWSCAMR